MAINVAHVMRTYGVHGGERQLARLFRSFDDPEFAHVFFSIYRDDDCAQTFGNIENLQTQTLLPLKARTFPTLLIESLRLLLLLPILQWRLYRSLRQFQSQIVIAHGVQAALVSWPSAVLLRSINFVYIHRGTKSEIGRWAPFKLLYRPFRKVLGISQTSMKSLEGLAPHQKLGAIENGVDLTGIDKTLADCPTSNRDNLVVICVGRLIPLKEQSLLLDAFQLFTKAQPDAEFWLVGDGPDREALEQQAAALGIAGQVKLLGHQSEVICLLSQSDIFMHASRTEGLSNAVLEAMAVRIPCIVVDAPGVSECHEKDVTGFVVERTAEAVSAKLVQLAQDKKLRAAMGRKARGRVEAKFSTEANWKLYSSLYRDLLSLDRLPT